MTPPKTMPERNLGNVYQAIPTGLWHALCNALNLSPYSSVKAVVDAARLLQHSHGEIKQQPFRLIPAPPHETEANRSARHSMNVAMKIANKQAGLTTRDPVRIVPTPPYGSGPQPMPCDGPLKSHAQFDDGSPIDQD